MQRLMTASAQFEAETQQVGTSARDNMLKELATGFDTYQELSSNLQEGTQVCHPSCVLLYLYSDFITPCNSHKSVKRDPCLIWKVYYIA